MPEPKLDYHAAEQLLHLAGAIVARAALVCCLLLLLGGLATTAVAGEAGDAGDASDALLQRAIEQFNSGDYAQSRVLLQRARRRAKDASTRSRIDLHIGLSHALENNNAAARLAFRQALLADPKARVDPYRYKPAIVRLFDKVRSDLEGELQVTTAARGASVLLDGSKVGETPARVRALEGNHQLVIRRGGSKIYDKNIAIVAGQVMRIVLDASNRQQPAPRRRGAPSPPSSAGQNNSGARVWTWVAGASALACVAAAVAVGFSADADYDDACALLDPAVPCGERPARVIDPDDAARYEDLQDSVSAKTLTANTLWVSAATLAVTSVVLFFLEGRDAAAPRKGASLAPAFGGLSATLRF